MVEDSELIGGIRNALERGEPIEKVKQSFLNAGYTPEEIERASRESSQIQKITISSPETLQKKPKQKKQKKKFSLFKKKIPLENKKELTKKTTILDTPKEKIKPLPSVNKPIQKKQKTIFKEDMGKIKPLNKPAASKPLGYKKDLNYAPTHTPSKVNKLLVVILIIITSILVLLLGLLATYWNQLFY